MLAITFPPKTNLWNLKLFGKIIKFLRLTKLYN